MSRAFVNEDNFVEELPNRVVSDHPNFVTAQGLKLIDAALEAARRSYSEAAAASDREALTATGRNLHYWSARRASAEVVAVVPCSDTVKFGNSVTFVRDDGRRQTFRIVGEDEADAARGTISHVSPLARELIGKRVGETLQAGQDEAEIVAIA